MRALWSIPFCPGDGRQVGLLYIAAGWRNTTRHRDVFAWHLVRQPRTLLVSVCHNGFFHVPVDLLLRPIRRPHEPVEACQLQHEAHQAYPTGANLHTDQMERQDQAMQERKTRDAVKKRYDRGTLIKVLLVCPPRLQRAARDLKHRGRLTLRHPLYFQLAIPRPQVRAFEALPALMAICAALLRILDDCSHSYLLCTPFASAS